MESYANNLFTYFLLFWSSTLCVGVTSKSHVDTRLRIDYYSIVTSVCMKSKNNCDFFESWEKMTKRESIDTLYILY